MVLVTVGLIIVGFTIALFLIARKDWTEDVSDISPFPEEVQMVQFIQKFSMVVTLILSIAVISLGLWLIVKGLVVIM